MLRLKDFIMPIKIRDRSILAAVDSNLHIAIEAAVKPTRPYDDVKDVINMLLSSVHGSIQQDYVKNGGKQK